MSVHRLTRGQRLMGKLGAAAVIATLSGVPQELAHWFAGDIDTSSMTLAGKPPKPPTPPPPSPPPPSVPDAEALNADPDTTWFAAWHENTAATAPPNFFATPTNLSGVPFMQTQLNGSALAGRPLGIKIEKSPTFAEGAALFNTKYQPGDRAISYVFADFEQGTRDETAARIGVLVAQVRISQWSKNAYVGQWDMTPLNPEDEKFGRPPTLPPGGQIGSAHRRWGRQDYDNAKVNMANTSLYPGANDMRNTATGDWLNNNIRTGLFIAPIGRMTQVQNILDMSYNGTKVETKFNNHKQIPWIARFNNFGNTSLDNADLPGLTYVFDAHAGSTISTPNGPRSTENQLLGRGDVSAMARHYRMRGAYSVNLFESGVVDYSQTDFQNDVRDGWKGDARLNNIMAQSDNKYATMTLNPTVDGISNSTRAEQTGTIWSGQYSLDVPNTNSKKNQGDLMILASNLDSADHLINFGQGDTPYPMFITKDANGYTWDDGNVNAGSRNALIEAGMHRIFQFDFVETRVYDSLANLGSNKKNTYQTKQIWMLNQQYLVFNNNNDRNGMGIPEPTTFGSLAAAGAIAVVCRRQRRKV